ncbi:MAG: type IV pilin protein [Gemmatimonadaceae bacterium]
MRHSRAGFTLIELLIVVVIIGILAAIAIPKFANTKEKAYFAKMKGDLRNLASAQEAYTADNGGLYGSGAVTGPNALPGMAYGPSSGVTLEVTASPTGWSAVASMAPQTAKKCGMFVDNDDPPNLPGGDNPATTNGEPKCN